MFSSPCTSRISSSLTKLACLAAVVLCSAHSAAAHCQVPCGIYDDSARVIGLKEDAATIAKAVAQLESLASKKDALSKNQFSRWVMTKEEHASNIIKVISEYFLTQKVKPKVKGDSDYSEYVATLLEHHAVMVAAMKVKQTVDKAQVSELEAALAALEKRYGGHKH